MSTKNIHIYKCACATQYTWLKNGDSSEMEHEFDRLHAKDPLAYGTHGDMSHGNGGAAASKPTNGVTKRKGSSPKKKKSSKQKSGPRRSSRSR
jgi:hypothetical protein